MTHLAQFDAVNAVTGRYASYAVNLAAPGAFQISLRSLGAISYVVEASSDLLS